MRDIIEDWLNRVETELRHGLSVLPKNLTRKEVLQIGARIDLMTDSILEVLAHKKLNRIRIISEYKGRVISYRFVCPGCKSVLDGTFDTVELIKAKHESMVRYYCPICDKYQMIRKSEFIKGKHNTMDN